MEPYKKFLVPLNFNKLNLFIHSNSLTQKATNAPHFISQYDPPAPKEIMVPKMWTDLSVLSGSIGASIKPENAFQERKEKLNHFQRCQ